MGHYIHFTMVQQFSPLAALQPDAFWRVLTYQSWLSDLWAYFSFRFLMQNVKTSDQALAGSQTFRKCSNSARKRLVISPKKSPTHLPQIPHQSVECGQRVIKYSVTKKICYNLLIRRVEKRRVA
jgi:hypothetical protein